MKPNAPTSVTTTELNNGVTISWTPANADSFTAYGSAVTSYVIEVLQSDGTTYTQQLAECDGTDATIVSNNACTISVFTLMAAPYNLALTDSVTARLAAINDVG